MVTHGSYVELMELLTLTYSDVRRRLYELSTAEGFHGGFTLECQANATCWSALTALCDASTTMAGGSHPVVQLCNSSRLGEYS